MSLKSILEAIAFPTDWQVFTPESILLLFAIMLPIVGARNSGRRDMQQFALIGLVGAFLLTLGSLLGVNGGPFSLEYIQWSALSAAAGHPVADVFRVTEASQALKLLFLGVGIVATLGMGRPLKGKAEEDWGELYSLLLFAILGMMVVASSRELITLVLGIEMASLSSYLMAGFRRDRIGAEAGLKYFAIGAASSGMLLFAVSLLYGMAGTTTFTGLAAAITEGSGVDTVSVIAIVLLLAGLGFKVSSVPFHAWAPDVYSGAPAPVAGVLASASKAMGFVAIAQVFLVGLAGVKANWELAVALVAIASMFIGNLVALQQTNLRRMLAYSSIAQAGYLLIAIAVGTAFALGGAVLHLWVNAAMKLGAFLVIGALLYAGIPDHVDGWKGLGRRAPFLAFAMVLFLLSMAGLPPLGGFTSKFVLFSSAVDAGVSEQLGWLTVLAVVAVVNSAISLYYYLRVIRAMYVESPDGDAAKVQVGPGTNVAVALCAAFVLLVGVWPQWFVEAAMTAARGLLVP